MSNNSTAKGTCLPLGKLIGLVNSKKEQLLNKHLVPFGMTSAQFKVLAVISFDAMESPAEICKYLCTDSGSFTRMIGRLVQKNLIEKHQNPEDKRGVLLSLTPSGQLLLNQCKATMEQDLTPQLTGDLSPQEVEQLSNLLKRLLL